MYCCMRFLMLLLRDFCWSCDVGFCYYLVMIMIGYEMMICFIFINFLNYYQVACSVLLWNSFYKRKSCSELSLMALIHVNRPGSLFVELEILVEESFYHPLFAFAFIILLCVCVCCGGEGLGDVEYCTLFYIITSTVNWNGWWWRDRILWNSCKSLTLDVCILQWVLW